METNTALCSQIQRLKVLVWMDWTNLNLRANQNARINTSPGIFSLDFRPVFWECTVFLVTFYWWKENFAGWAIQTRLGHLAPQAVYSVFELCDFEMVFRLPPDGSTLISIPIVGFVQSESRTALRHTMMQWFADATWAPVPCGLISRLPRFLR